MSIDDPTEREALCQAAHDWREKLDAEEPSAEHLAAFERWLEADVRNAAAWERSQTLIAAYDHLQRQDIDADLLPCELAGPVAREAGNHRRPGYLAIAAVALTLLASIPAALFLLQGGAPTPVLIERTYATATAEIDTVTMVDGTRITLGAATELRVVYGETSRTAELVSGAAIFAVASDPERSFAVSAGDLKATAVGTEFEVRSNGGVQRVAVAEGTVEVSYASASDHARPSRRLLAAGTQVAATRTQGLRPVESIDPAKVAAWRESRLVYDGATIEELVADANRYSDRPIVLDATAATLAGQTITASFDATDREGLLDTLAYVFPIEVDDSEPRRIVLYRKATD
ncbi:MAG: FecR domain-containing protein [Pseudomonadota bacterium]